MLARLAGSTVLATLILAAGTIAVSAAPAVSPPSRERPDTMKRVAESVAEVDDDTGTCSRARRRLWVEGEGWVVRRVTTCR